ncbi:manganese ABC transporter ATP-binding protein [Listeria fleischmannii FSL S10-1203]|uniref:Manganese ABC transporter ATP-binding protein n=1 Tax=Listeria fleischmannii FSL S10-1203 TaxID=1265822 RepID=W7DMW0_9LIST|nr:manganese ABC transporter ATP-binding protein [Listeria fleischmannii FSL S10-1203]
MYISNLTVDYKEKRVLDRIHMAIQTGCITGIVGPNGAGKSTLLKAMLGLIRCESGEATLFDVPLHQIKQKIAYVPQRSEIDLTFPINVLEMVLLGTYPSLALTRKPKRREKEKALHALRQVDMESYQKKTNWRAFWGTTTTYFYGKSTRTRC